MTCPTCGKAMLSEWPHQHAHLELRPVDSEPPPRRSGCSIFPWLALILVWVLW